ncbi:DUF4387 domain-containing protein [Niameybacter massiliensis]|uniref:DUF4387 domain-containing protein n=1 Tax=Niameybacter massiliensis TaxID=1658108 RepID=UPI0006B4B45C|nr:DUF4387 domain-containing protein [Niameybacter massiliensis]
MPKCYELAKVLRSKNSGPFEITLDILFDNEASYNLVKNSNKITKSTIAKLYHMDESMINDIIFFDTALGIKITYARKISSGTCFERDVYGSQQHAPLMELEI